MKKIFFLFIAGIVISCNSNSPDSENKPEIIKSSAEEDKLNKWTIGDFVDEFGDKTAKQYPYIIVNGKHENSSSESDVFVKVYIEDKTMCIQIFNELNTKEALPSMCRVDARIKFPNGDVKEETFFCAENIAVESSDNETKILYNYLTKETGKLKILLDFNIDNRACSGSPDKYQFEISKNNLDGILSKLK